MKKERNSIYKNKSNKIRVANVSFLNGSAFKKLSLNTEIEYSQHLPSECSRRLFEGEADLALVPLADFFKHGGLTALNYGIIANSEVKSVILYSKCPLQDIEKVYVDSASNTSILLTRLLLAKNKTRNIKFFRKPSDKILDLVKENTAGLVIGDNSLFEKNFDGIKIDLAKEWTEGRISNFDTSHLPFVFALWAYKSDSLKEDEIKHINLLLEDSIKDSNFFAKEWAIENNKSIDDSLKYVNETISYQITDLEIKSINSFAKELEIIQYLSQDHSVKNTNSKTSLKVNELSLDEVLEKASIGKRLSIKEALLIAENASFADISLAAEENKKQLEENKRIRKDKVSYIIDRNINYTNVCNVYCRFCAFYTAPNKGGYLLTKEQIGKKIQETVDAGGIQILLQGGLNPELGIEYYEDLFSWIKANYPINLHALSSDEILHICQVSKLTIEETISRLIKVGLGSLPGGGAELLVDRVRARIAGLKCKASDWIEVHRTAHLLGITSTCTLMFGVGESWEDRILHMHKLRELQDETGGFTAFITWPFQDENTKLKPGDTSTSEYLKVQAMARLFLDNIDNIQSSWVTMGPSIGQIALSYGANDFGSVMFEENVVSAAGTTYYMDEELIRHQINEAGYTAFKRNVHYKEV